MTTEEPRTPLTLEFSPDNIAEEGIPEEFQPLAVCEPSAIDAGRIFLGVNPVGKRLGVHLLPEEARRIRNHLTKLLMEQPDVDPQPVDGSYETPEQRLARAVERAGATAKKNEPTKPKRKWFQFRFEFQIGDIQGVIGRLVK